MCLIAPLCAHFPLLMVLKQFWNLITLFCTRAVWKFSNPMDFSWGNANLFKPELVVKIQLQPSLSALQTWEGAPTETPPLPRQYLHRQLGFRLEGKGTQPPLLGQCSHVQTHSWDTELSGEQAVTHLPLLPLLPRPPVTPPTTQEHWEGSTLWESTAKELCRVPNNSLKCLFPSLRRKAFTDAPQAVTISFPQSLQRSQPQPAVHTQLLARPALEFLGIQTQPKACR